MEEHICIEEGESINLQEAEDVCPNCEGEVISVNDMTTDDWCRAIENVVGDEIVDVEVWLKCIEMLKQDTGQ